MIGLEGDAHLGELVGKEPGYHRATCVFREGAARAGGVDLGQGAAPKLPPTHRLGQLADERIDDRRA